MRRRKSGARSQRVTPGRVEVAVETRGHPRYPGVPLPARDRPHGLGNGPAYARVADGRITEWVEVIDALGVVRQICGLSATLTGCYPINDAASLRREQVHTDY